MKKEFGLKAIEALEYAHSAGVIKNTQSYYDEVTDAYCSLGWIAHYDTKNQNYFDAADYYRYRFFDQDMTSDEFSDIAELNDNPDSTWQDMINLIKGWIQE